MRQKLSLLTLCCLLLLAHNQPAMAQQRAALMTVRYGVVEVQRVGTSAWLRVPVGAVMPLVAGDSVRTKRSGRVHFALSNGAELLMLQDSQLTLITYSDAAVAPQFEASVEGITIWRFQDPAAFGLVALHATNFTLTQFAEHFAVWSLPEQHDTLAVALGQASAEINERPYVVTQGQALWSDPANPQYITLEPPVNAVRVEAELFGCRGIVQTTRFRGVNVRRGIGQQEELLGLIPNGAEVLVLARNRADYWLRVQYLSTFSWIVKEAVRFNESNCPNLRVFPDNSPLERIGSVVNALNSEVALLEPFFSTPPNDWLFYRYEQENAQTP